MNFIIGKSHKKKYQSSELILYSIRDSFFVIKGLLLSDQDTLARNMIENFFDFIDEYGFIRKLYTTFYTRLEINYVCS